MQQRRPLTALASFVSAAALAAGLLHCSSSTTEPSASASPDAAAAVDPGNDASTSSSPEAGEPDAGARLGSMSTGRSLLAATSGTDGRIRSLGGLTMSGLSDSVETYDPIANTWTLGKGKSSVHRYAHAAAEDANGHVYVVGGTSDGKSPIATAEIYSTADDAWTAIADMPTPRLGLGVTVGKDGRVYAIGGGAPGAPSDVVEIYSPDTHAWTTGPKMPTKRLSLVVVTGADGLVYAIGGRDANATPLAVVEAFDPVEGTWSTPEPLGTARYWFGATRGEDGRIYALGGVGTQGFLDSAEVFTPGVGWQQLPAMPETRAWHGAAASKDGRVFTVGGSTDVDEVPGSTPPPMKTMLALDTKTGVWSH